MICEKCGKPAEAQGVCPACLADMLANPTGDPVQAAPFKPGDTFHGLEIVSLLGRGGMGVVYKARQPNLDRFVALKILPKLEFRERFEREAKVLAGLSHPNIVAVHDFGIEGDFGFLVMEYVDGLSMRELLRRARPKPPEALAFVRQLCDALEYAHQEKVVHRDIKPENILIDQKGRLKVADFGIAKLIGEKGLTRPDVAVGTPHYIAPEQWENPKEADHRVDIYALGVVFYELLTGELPIGRFPEPSRKVEIDVRLDEVVLKALEKEPRQRYQRAAEVGKEITRITEHPLSPRNAPASGRVIVMAAGALAVVTAGVDIRLWNDLFRELELDRTAFGLAVTTGFLGFSLAAMLFRRGPLRRWALLSGGLSLLGGLLALAGYARAQSFPHPITPPEVMERREYSGQLRPLPPGVDPGGERRTEDSVGAALKWLGDHQGENGSWSVTNCVNRCIGPEPCLPNPGTDATNVAVTGLSLLAFLGAGYSPLSKDELGRGRSDGKIHLLHFGNITRDGLGFLMSQQDSSGVIGSTRYRRHLLNHLFATLALVEAYGMTATEKYKEPAQRAILAAFRSQNSDGGWGDLEGVSDAFCTMWMVLLGQSAKRAGMDIGGNALVRAEQWLNRRIDPVSGRPGYRTAGTDGAVLGKEEAGSTTTLTALALLAAGKSERFETWMTSAEKTIGSTPDANDFFDGFIRTAGLKRRDGPFEVQRRAWYEEYKKMLVTSQATGRQGCRNGSWEPTDRWSPLGGRVYATAINTMGLEIYYRYANALFQ